jgi:hypothetical protein
MRLLQRLSIALLLATAATAQAAEPRTFGAGMPEGAAQSIAVAIDAYTADAAEPAKYSGRVAKVCRQKGCWMELESDGRSARVTMLDYGFFLPTDAQGRAEVFGTLSQVELDEETAQHYAEDAGIAVTEVQRREYRLLAHSVTLLDR